MPKPEAGPPPCHDRWNWERVSSIAQWVESKENQGMIYVCVCVCVCVNLYVYMYMCVCVYIMRRVIIQVIRVNLEG